MCVQTKYCSLNTINFFGVIPIVHAVILVFSFIDVLNVYIFYLTAIHKTMKCLLILRGMGNLIYIIY